ncbi:hypothetical protein ACFLZB_00550 [Nanoarchaeota archaeon]
MVGERKTKRVIRCPGRFSELREYIHFEAVPTVLEDSTTVTKDNLKDIWDLIETDVFSHDTQDPYFANAKCDSVRNEPKPGYLSLVPLFPSTFHLDDKLVREYSKSMGNRPDIAKILDKMAEQPGKFFQSVLKREPSKVFFPGGTKLSGYVISANFGIGTASSGGVKRGGIRSDSPYLLEVYRVSRTTDEQNLVAVVGFWAQENSMLVSQMQSCKNAQLPEDVPFGVACLYIAETAAREMGFDRILAYSAKGHPIFREHPTNWSQFGKEFVSLWDGSARKLGYKATSGRNGHYIKNLTNHSKKNNSKK